MLLTAEILAALPAAAAAAAVETVPYEAEISCRRCVKQILRTTPQDYSTDTCHQQQSVAY